jgi:hypothetical protein
VPVTFQEQLRVPVRWWVLAAVAVLALVVAAAAAVGLEVAVPAGLLAGAGLLAWLLGMSRLRTQVDGTGLRVGAAHLPAWAVGEVAVLRGDEAARAEGTAADPRAYYVLRGWVNDAVRVSVADPNDPVPYWLVSSRRPDELARALAGVRARSS